MVKSLKFPTNNIYNIILGIGVFCILLIYYYQSNDDKIRVKYTDIFYIHKNAVCNKM